MTETTSSGGDSGSSLLDKLPMERLTEAAQSALSQLASKAIDAALERVDGMTGRLTDVAGNGGSGLMNALTGGGDDDGEDDDDSGDGGGKGGFTGMLKSAKDKVSGALGFGGGDDEDSEDEDGSGGGGSAGGGRGSFKFMNILETVDIGAPLRVVYDQWTQMGDFPSFMKKVESVDQESDEKVSWKAQVFWSHRTWDTTIREQIPDTHIIWTSSGAKGSADGHVSFHSLGPNLTRVVLNMEYYPQGFFEKTGNLWRAVGRRTRLEFKHFARNVHLDTLLDLEDLEGWRGEIRDSEVVKTHEEAIEEEQRAEDGEDVDEYDPEEEPYEDFADEDELDDDEDVPDEELSDEDLPEDENVAEDEDVPDGEDVADEPAEDDVAEDEESEDGDSGEAEAAEQRSSRSSRRRRRQPANA